MRDEPAVQGERLRLAFVLWSGVLGGAETFTASLAVALRPLGVDARVVFVGDAARLGHRLDAADIPFEALRLGRGRNVVRRPRRLARAVTRAGSDGAILIEGGFLPAALRLGGYPGKIVAVEHGAALLVPRFPPLRRFAHRLSRSIGARAVDAWVAVSESVVSALGRTRRPIVVVPNGIDLDRFRPNERERGTDELVIGCMARLVPGKGVDDVVTALARTGTEDVSLRVAGDGPERRTLESLATRLGVASRVHFVGWVDDAAAFWRSCDLAVVPSRWAESFGLTAAEAMATGLPVVATRSGALDEVVADGATGSMVPPGDPDAIAAALRRYAADPTLVTVHGRAARRRCEERFDIRRCAASYRALFDDLDAANSPSRA